MSVYDVISEQRVKLAAEEAGVVRDLLKSYEKAEETLEESIAYYQRRIEAAARAGMTISPSWVFQEERLGRILEELQGEMIAFRRSANSVAKGGAKKLYELGAVHALRAGEAAVIGNFGGLNERAFEVGAALVAQGSPVRELLNNIGPDVASKFKDVTAQALAEGWNPRKTAAALKDEVKAISSDRAVLIARTEQIRSYRVASKEVFSENKDVLRGWRWTSAKTLATCPLCLALDGEIFPADQVLSSHPACRCSMMPLPKHDFGGRKPKVGEEWFSNLSEDQQVKILGKRKTELYRKGEITLKDNVKWQDSPEWGRQPKPRSIRELEKMIDEGTLPSKSGPVNLSGFTPEPAKTLEELEKETPKPRRRSAPKAASEPEKVLTPEEAALEEWEKAPRDKKGPRVGMKSVKSAKYKKNAPPPDEWEPGRIVEVEIDDLTSSMPYVSDAKVVSYIKKLGDGDDLPLVVESEGRLFIHDGDSVARIQAKKLLGQTRTNVRLFTEAQVLRVKTPVELIIEELKGLGVASVLNNSTDEVEALASLEWAKERIVSTGVAPETVVIRTNASSGLNPGGKTLIVGPDRSDKAPVASLQNAVKGSPIASKTKPDYLDFKVQQERASYSIADNVEAAMIGQKIKLDPSVKERLASWAEDRLNLETLRAFESGKIREAVEEAVILYRRGEYRLGSFPPEFEDDFLKQVEKVVGPRSVLPAYTEYEVKAFKIVGPQGGSNPGGTYVGMDGVARYLKFYQKADQAEAEYLSSLFYEGMGVGVPKASLFKDPNGLSVIATEILEGAQKIGTLGAVSVPIADEILDGYVTDAFVANWDAYGLSGDNMVLAGGKVYRIDLGGTWLFRAQGGDKTSYLLSGLDELESLASASKGQLHAFVNTLGGLGSPRMLDKVESQSVKLAAFIRAKTGTAKGESLAQVQAAAEAWLSKEVPTLTVTGKATIARAIAIRLEKLDEKVEQIKKIRAALKNKPKPGKYKDIAKRFDAGKQGSEAAKLFSAINAQDYSAASNAMEAFYSSKGFTATEISTIKNFISTWTGEGRTGTFHANMYSALKEIHSGNPKSSLAFLIIKLKAVKEEAIKAAISRFGGTLTDKAIRGYRGHSNDKDAIAEVLIAWRENRNPRAKTHESASFAHRVLGHGKDFSKKRTYSRSDYTSGAGAFLAENSVLYVRDFTFDEIIFSQLTDDSNFFGYRSEFEFIPDLGPENSLEVSQDSVVFISGQKYTKKNAAAAILAYERRYGPLPLSVTFNDRVRAFFNLETRAENLFVEGPSPLLGPYALDDLASHLSQGPPPGTPPPPRPVIPPDLDYRADFGDWNL